MTSLSELILHADAYMFPVTCKYYLVFTTRKQFFLRIQDTVIDWKMQTHYKIVRSNCRPK